MEIQIWNHRSSLTQRQHKDRHLSQNHAITGEQSLRGSSSVALWSLLRPQVVKMSPAAETRYLCVQTNAEANTEAVVSVPACLCLLTAHTADGQSGRAWAPAPAPGLLPSPSSPPQKWHPLDCRVCSSTKSLLQLQPCPWSPMLLHGDADSRGS